MSYAVIETGGKQYRVSVGQAIEVEKLDGSVGDEVTLGRVLLVANEGSTTVGTPVVEGAAVKATIEAQHLASVRPAQVGGRRHGDESAFLQAAVGEARGPSAPQQAAWQGWVVGSRRGAGALQGGLVALDHHEVGAATGHHGGGHCRLSEQGVV